VERSLIHSCTPVLVRKAFGYLKRVIVTPGVYRGFDRLNPGFTDLHRPGFTNCTSACALAVRYVFIKQSSLPSHCDLGTPPHSSRGKVPKQALSRSYRSNLPNSLACL